MRIFWSVRGLSASYGFVTTSREDAVKYASCHMTERLIRRFVLLDTTENKELLYSKYQAHMEKIRLEDEEE